ncbi:MAG: ATP-dependent RecD-like DNA helicase [Clostridia bacterium]|nr:ATP-dependent RecD-like DNA helicase [Clostridia bacterium]
MELRGEIKTVIFRSDDTGYTVLDMKVEDSIFTVVGIFPPVSEGQNIRVEGKFQTKTVYGRQFFADKVYVSQPSRIDGIRRFLGSGLIHGLGPVTAEAIVDRFGVNSLEMMKHPMELSKVRGISLRRATEFGMEYSKIMRMQDSIVFLQELGISINLALKIYRVYDEKTEEFIRKNPSMLVDDIDGVGFATADRIAGELGIARDSDYRITAGIIHVLKEASSRHGHNYLPQNELLNAVFDLLKLDCDDPDQRIRDNVEDMVLFGDLVRYDTGEHVAVVLKANYKTEESIARRLIMLQSRADDFRVDVTDAVHAFEAEAGFSLHPKQIEAVKDAVENGVQIVTGGPGTGKTTIVKCILHLFKNLGQRVVLCAPTGRAAKRLSEATGEDARTIHRLLDLDYKDGQGCFTYNDQTRLPADVIIVDEMSMVDEYVFNSLVKAINNGARLVLVGDKDQLASVGAGNVLGDLIASGKFPVSYLTQIYRQSEDSHIIPNAHKVNNGEMPLMDNKSRDFFFEEKASAEEIARTTIDLVTKRLPKYLGVRPDEIQVLCPMKRGSAGIYVLNRHLQAVLNPPSKEKKEFRCGEFVFREGDKVMQMQNNYQQEWTQTVGFKVERGLGVYNGDIGVIESINMHIMQFIVRFEDDKVAIYQYEDAEQLALAYAVTIHKSQGSEFDAVVIALDANYMLQSRNLLYTAVTRAKKLVVIAGSRATVGRMVKNNETARRYSLLVNLINDELCGVHRQ